MTTATIEEVQARLLTLIAGLQPGEEIVIVENDRPIARLIAERGETRAARQPGSAIGKLLILEEDENHLKDFEEYMP